MTNITTTSTGVRGALTASLAVAGDAKEEARRLAWDDAEELTRPVQFGAEWDSSRGCCTAAHGEQPEGTLWSPSEGIEMEDREPLTYARALIMTRDEIAAVIRPTLSDLADADREAIAEGIHS